jgi:hypothetical protein
MRLQLISVAVVALWACVASAQETKKTDPKIEYDVDINFLNGSTVRLRIQSEKLEIETIYGKLTVPMRDVRSIDFGSHMPEGYAEKIDAAVKRLAHSDFREREKAAALLVELGPYSYAAAVEATKAAEAEQATRAKGIVQKLHAKHPKKDLKIATDDRVITPTLTINGKILAHTLKARADYFGVVELSLADMRTLKSLGMPSAELTVSIDAGKYAAAGQWMATSFQVDGKSNLVITAKGQVDLAPDQGGILVGPNGVKATSPFAGKVGKAKATSGGLLVGKIGEDGDTFIIGDRYDNIPAQAGTLYLHINPSPYGSQAQGSYEVRVRKAD